MSCCSCEEKKIDYEKLDQLLAPYQGQPSALIEVLHRAQELVGYLPKEVQIRIADALGVSLGEVYAVVSFYSHFSIKPKGKYRISLCKGTACYVKGSPDVLEKIEHQLGIKAGDSTDDGLFSLEVVRCLGACGLGPVMTVNENAHGLLKPDKAVDIIENYRQQ
ncbi:MAG: NAD(P)H-dependent oxidoreductase subunit E [Clostridia bacterium]|jgi:NADH:ubiquinone oxidoreductase subunit E|nr:NAD(P)H-dependent oxidoreductase subunit E [Clostridia bacterium]